MNAIVLTAPNTAIIPASGIAMPESRYRTGHTGLALTGQVCLQVATSAAPAPGSSWVEAMSGAAGTEAGRPSALREFSDFSKPRYGSQASDGTG